MERKKSLFQMGKSECAFEIEKKGKIRRVKKNLDIQYKRLLCVITKNKHFDAMYFPNLYGDIEQMMNKIDIIKKAQEDDIQYIIIRKKDKNSDFKDSYIAILRKEYLKEYCISTYAFQFAKKKDKELWNEMYATFGNRKPTEDEVCRYLGAQSIQIKLHSNQISKQDILIRCFYNSYIKYLNTELIEKYGIGIKNFHNYEQLYDFLDEKGYISYFYNKMGPQILYYVDLFIQKIQERPLFEKYMNHVQTKEIKSFKTFSIPKLIQTFVPQNIQKKELLQYAKK
jgi:hypothetical protein